jgi:hypothetical protein
LRLGSGDAGANALDDNRPLELGEHAEHLEERAAGRRGGVYPLLMKVQVAADGAQLAQEGD